MGKITLWNVLCLVVLGSFEGYSQTDVLTQHNDLGRTGWNSQETILNTTNVNNNSFGRVASRTVDDQIYAQPLVVSGVSIGGGTKNVVYVATVNNSIYAFDADDTSSGATYYWMVNLTPAGCRPPQKQDVHPGLCGGGYSDFAPTFVGPNGYFGNFGIVGTPVIDKAKNILYVVSRYVDLVHYTIDQGPHQGKDCRNGATVDFDTAYSTAGFFQILHAIDLRTGADVVSPVTITASAPGNGSANVGGVISFDPRRNNQRGGLVLSNGIVYVPYAAHCDWDNAHGWLLGFDASTLQQRMAFLTTPNDSRGGIWMSGAAPAVDAAGNIYLSTGNARVGDHTAACSPALDPDYDFTNPAYSPAVPANRGESIVELTPTVSSNTLAVSSYFSPFNFQYLNDADLDFSIQVMLIPNTNLILAGCKDANLYLMQQNSLGGFNTNSNNVVQTVNVGSGAQMHSSLAYFGGASTQYVYQWAENTNLQAYPIVSGLLGTPIVSSVNNGPTGASGAYMSVSSNGGDTSTGILWATQAVSGCNANQGPCVGELRALDAANVTKELWNSSTDFQDNYPFFSKMSSPTIANGKVYVPTQGNALVYYGLKPYNPCATNIALGKNAHASSTNGSFAPANAFDGNSTSQWGSLFSDNQFLQVDLGSTYNICGVTIDWTIGSGATIFGIDVSSDGVNWTNVDTLTNNTLSITSINGSWAGRYVRMSASLRQDQAGGYGILEMEVFGAAAGSCATPVLLPPSAVDPNHETISWYPVPGATSYNIGYKVPIVNDWLDTSAIATALTLGALTCNQATYDYQVQAVCSTGTSPFNSGSFLTLPCNTFCGSLPTRYYHADLGDIGLAGNACLDVATGIYTITGSGSGIGGLSDQFQYAFTNYLGDQQTSAEVLTQDAASPNDQAGVMMRDSLSITSRFMFVGLQSGGQILLVYRSTPGGTTNSVTLSGFSAPYYVKINKTGTQYAAFASSDGITWTAVGAPVDLGFGSSSIYTGMAVSSSTNAVISTATFKFFPPSQTPAVDLLSFTATNANNQYVALNWSTSEETNLDYFSVERSTDSVNFQTITTVSAVGTSEVTQNYLAQDPNPVKGANYYQLKMVADDSSFSYSPIRLVLFDTSATGPSGPPTMNPNPAGPYVYLTAGAEAIKDITIFDATGRTVLTLLNSSGSASITIPTANLATGVYIIRIETATKLYEKELLKQ
jgi:F5/8 type C domain/Secretion system C-terminal sorting domain/PQQ-like domain